MSTRLRHRILVVDDNVDSAEGLGGLLRVMGHEVRVVHDGSAALACLHQAQPHLVLLDLSMPGISGHDTARQIRQRLGSEVRIVAVTGHARDDIRAEAIAAGFDHYLVKPVDPGFLKSLLG